MPTYEYVCRACEHEFELFQSMTDPVKRKCPQCGKLRLERLIGTGAGVIFKGSGFFETDYRSQNYSKAAEADRKAQSPDSDKSGESGSKKSTSDTGTKKDSTAKTTPLPASKSKKAD